MNIVLLQAKLSEEEIDQLLREFPQYLFLAFRETSYKNLGKEDWARVEVLYGNRLTAEELEMALQLRWIHSPVPNLNPLCLHEIDERGKIIITSMKEENATQIAEFVIGGVLAYAKNLFHWEDADRNPTSLWDSKWRESMWSLEGRTFLQIGLGVVGTEIARRAKDLGMHVWGVHEQKTFHPFCQKIFSMQELHSVLPAADVVSVALPRGKQKLNFIKRSELELMRDEAILSIVGMKNIVDEDALATLSKKGKFRGVLLDAYYQMPIAQSSKLWEAPNIIITPEVAPRPKTEKGESMRVFRYNLRQYLHSNFTDMRNVLSSKG